MRMLFIMGSSLALTLGLRLIDPPEASAVSPPAIVLAADTLVVAAPRAGRQRPLIVPYGALKEPGVAGVRSASTEAGVDPAHPRSRKWARATAAA